MEQRSSHGQGEGKAGVLGQAAESQARLRTDGRVISVFAQTKWENRDSSRLLYPGLRGIWDRVSLGRVWTCLLGPLAPATCRWLSAS